MTVFTQGPRTGDYLLTEANGYRSREEITIVSGAGKLSAGTVLGKITTGGALSAVAAALAGNTGNGVLTLANPAVAAGAAPGVYQVRFVEPAANAGAFLVEAPDGTIVGDGTVGVAFDGAVKFTIADGATDFAAGDGFSVTVTEAAATGAGKYTPATMAAVDGSQVAVAVLYAAVDATSADQPAVAHARDCEVKIGSLVFAADVDQDAERNAKIAQLAAVGIIAR